MIDHQIKFLVVKYLSGNASLAEKREFKNWLSLHPENEFYYVEMCKIWNDSLIAKPYFMQEDEAYENFLKNIKSNQTYTRPIQLRKKRIFRLTSGAISLGVILSILFFYLLNNRSLFSLKNKWVDRVIGQTISTKNISKSIILKDGTMVLLNANSTINLDRGFAVTNRNISLDGEAFFEISHKYKSLPFIISTKKYRVQDIGTSFNIKSFSLDSSFETTVVKGEVLVQSLTNNEHEALNRIKVRANQVLKIKSHQEIGTENAITSKSRAAKVWNEVGIIPLDPIKINPYTKWTENILDFDGATLCEILKCFSLHYKVEIELKSEELSLIKYTGNFKKVPDIQTAIHILEVNTPIKAYFLGKKVIITSNP